MKEISAVESRVLLGAALVKSKSSPSRRRSNFQRELSPNSTRNWESDIHLQTLGGREQ